MWEKGRGTVLEGVPCLLGYPLLQQGTHLLPMLPLPLRQVDAPADPRTSGGAASVQEQPCGHALLFQPCCGGQAPPRCKCCGGHSQSAGDSLPSAMGHAQETVTAVA